MVREDFKLRSQVKVVSEITEKRVCLRTYRFDLLHEPVEIPYCSWANLDCCGGWSFDEEYLDTAVQSGRKLFAGRTTSLKHKYLPNNPTKEEAEHQFMTLEETLPDGIFADIESGVSDPNCLHTFICRTGAISEYIDLDTVFSFYEKLRTYLSDAEKEEVRRLCDIEIKLYGADSAPFPYTRAATSAQLITTGLLLGYPLESTASILHGY